MSFSPNSYTHTSMSASVLSSVGTISEEYAEGVSEETFATFYNERKNLRFTILHTRREELHSLLKQAQDLLNSAQNYFAIQKKTVLYHKKVFKKKFNALTRGFKSSGSQEYKKQFLEPNEKKLKLWEDLANDLQFLWNKLLRETQSIEIRSKRDGGVCGVYKENDGQVEWQEGLHHGVCGVYHPYYEEIEWKQIFNQSVCGVWNPQQEEIQWRASATGGVNGCYNPMTRNVEWREHKGSGVCGVYNPVEEMVQWNSCPSGGIVGWYDQRERKIHWHKSRYHGLGAIVQKAGTGVYMSVSSNLRLLVQNEMEPSFG
eukprot:snap_masked-scaffold_9-processed-gene-7.52-mRNA-1 protein AED:1.00 eAED:1.00 QI:0/-1/0/0/-1/1/1/0/314